MKAKLTVIMTILFAFNSVAQTPYFRKHTLPLEYKNAQIAIIVHDKNHFLWFGTTAGVIRFNGEQYKFFAEFPREDNNVTALFEDAGGTLWVGYKNGRIGRIRGE